MQDVKENPPPTSQGAPAVQRSRDDIQEFNLECILPEKEKVIEVVKKKALHCRVCDNKFTSLEALNRHNELKMDNIGNQVILARTYKNDGSQTISCRESGCCYSCDVAEMYTHIRYEHKKKI